MRSQHWLLLSSLLAIVAQGSMTVSAETTAYRVDEKTSHATIHVGKSGVFSFAAGHTHEVSGPVGGSVDVDRDAPPQSRLQLVIETAGLKVSASGEPEGDAPKVQAAMESDKVLDIARYPRITFTSTAIAARKGGPMVLDASVTGQLTIRDVTQSVAVPVRVQLGDNQLTATGRFTVKQTAFGIKPISVAGVVTVKDTLDIDFTITARK